MFRSGTHDTEFKTIPRDGVYDAVASVIVNDSDLEDSTKFECELKIPEANYTVRKSVVLTAGEYYIIYIFIYDFFKAADIC